MQAYAIDLLKRLDTNQNGVISFQEFSNGLKTLGINVTNHEEHALLRRFDHNRDGSISMEEFYNTLAQEF